VRKTFFKYLHPKEAYVGNGCLNDELVRYYWSCCNRFINRVAHGKAKDSSQKEGKYAKRYKDTKDEHAGKDENGGVKFVYPYGASLNVRKPSIPILSSGPISFPANRPIGAFYMSPKRGKLFVLGSMMFLEDEFFEKEDNQKIQEAVFKWLLTDGEAEFERNVKEDPELSDYVHVPDITALSDHLRSCL
jgi:intraflagellar transport protein 52